MCMGWYVHVHCRHVHGDMHCKHTWKVWGGYVHMHYKPCVHMLQDHVHGCAILCVGWQEYICRGTGVCTVGICASWCNFVLHVLWVCVWEQLGLVLHVLWTYTLCRYVQG